MREMTEPAAVGEQYASTERLETRRGVWGPGPEGVSPVDVLRTLVVSSGARRVLEVGCGTGDFARSVLDAAPGVDYVATDLSPAMVKATRALGVTSEVAAADALPFADSSFDGGVAAWMLYHVPDLDGALVELRRVLREGGCLHVVTNGHEHLGDLLREAGGEPLVTQFMSENATEVLRRHFEHVVQRDVETRATFPDHATARAYLATFAPDLADALPFFEGERTYAGRTAVLSAH
ncbi:class I SAM-dependent methyltransferase [Terrabacter sp. NPDC080008]|uniref:class I SAM-dependent methyltransferase n=1 Tax=Terrabacter sp. NPDC080008 TaxID=3155176 RepID=UPI00344E4277